MSLIDEIQKNPENIKSIGYLSESEGNPSRLDVELENGFKYQIFGSKPKVFLTFL